jgi:hypothetical protein
MEEAFQRMDGDNDGVVTHDEFMKACHDDSELCKILSRGILTKEGKSYLDLKEKSRIWHLIDKDLDDSLTREEMLSWYNVAYEKHAAAHAAEEKPTTPDSPGSIVSEEALEYEDDDFEGDESLNSDDIVNSLDESALSVDEQSMSQSMGDISMSPLSTGWNVEDASASANMIDKMGHVEAVDRVKK